jgi:predicted aldo/keto reductase-like oxidoreductase
MAVIIMEPLRGGNLAKTPPSTVKDIWTKADHKKPPVEWSLGWIWNHPEVTVVLSGMNNDDHINENLALAEKALPNFQRTNKKRIWLDLSQGVSFLGVL